MRWPVAVLGVAVVGLGGCALLAGLTDPAPAPTRATLFVSADLRGYLEPCGCSQNMRGGIARTAQVVLDAKAAAKGPVFYLDLGDGLFPAATLPEEAVGQQGAKARTLAKAFELMGLSVRVPGPGDDALGPAFHQGLGLPELRTGRVQLLDAGGYRVAVVAAESAAQAEVLAQGARRMKASFVVASLPTSVDRALASASEAPSVDLLVGARPKDELSAEANRLLGAQTKVAQVQNKGRSLLRVDLTLRGWGRTDWLAGTAERDRELDPLDQRIELTRAQIDDPSQTPLRTLRQAKLDELVGRRAALAAAPLQEPAQGNLAQARFVPIEPALPLNEAVAALEKAYDVEVGRLNLAWAQAHGKDCDPLTPDRPGYIGTVICSACHLPALEVWKHTRHAHAYEALEKAGKQYHLDCIACHVDGWQQPNGVCRIDKTDDRRQVSCEGCHGPGSMHLANPVKETAPKPTAAACTRCHDHENSPHFDFDSYVSQIKGPGHGLPLPK